MKKFLGILAVSILSLTMHAGVVNYTPDNETIFPNPERGFTDQINDVLSESNPSILDGDQEWFFHDEGERETQRLVVLVYYLTNYRTKALSEKVLNGFDADMQILRKYGFKCVLRFAYCESNKDDATLAQTQAHLAQLKPHLAKNADVIYVLEAGFVGQWGEWYYSKNHGNETQQLNANRRAILESLIDACPADRHLLVRYPLIKTQYLGDEKTLTAETAHDGSVRAKIGHHNDAFLNDWGNDGTYGRDGEGEDDDPVLRAYIAKETLYVPNGGETNVESSSLAKKVYANAEKEMREYHWSFCGAEYATQVTNLWRSSGIFNNLNRDMGYRFQLISSQWEEKAYIGQTMKVNIELKNVGYAPLYNARTAYLVLQSATKTYSLPLPTDPRQWTYEAGTIRIDCGLAIDESIAAGTYHLYLHMPDAYASIAKDARYAIRFANKDVWNAETGWNDLGASIEIAPNNTGVEQVQNNEVQSTKVFIDGSLYIMRSGKRYDMMGRCAE